MQHDKTILVKNWLKRANNLRFVQLKLIPAVLLMLLLSAFNNPYTDIPQELQIKGYYGYQGITPKWMLHNEKVRNLPKTPYKNLKRHTSALYYNGENYSLSISDYNRNGNLIKYVTGKPSNLMKKKSYLFDNNGLLTKSSELGSHDVTNYYDYYKYDERNRLIKAWSDLDKKGISIEYLNNNECIEYSRGDQTKRIKWNKEGIVLFCDQDNNYGDRDIYKYDEKNRIAFSICYSKYDTTYIDSAFFNPKLYLLSRKTFYKDKNKTGKLELYQSDKDEYVYDSNGFLAAEYNYNSAGQLQQKYIFKHNSTLEYNEYVIIRYFPVNKLVNKSIKRFNKNGQLFFMYEWSHTYNGITEDIKRKRYSGNLLIEEVQKGSYSSKTKYKYDKYGNLSEIISFDENGEIWDHTYIKNEITKDDSGRITSIKKFENGELSSEDTYEYYKNEVMIEPKTGTASQFNWYMILGVAGIICVIAFFIYRRYPFL